MRLFLVMLLTVCWRSPDVAAQAVFRFGGHRILLEEGDFIFRSGVGKESGFIRDFSSLDKTFTHVGILLKDKNAFWVYHMLGGFRRSGGDLRKDSISRFIRYPENECFGIYHASLTKIQVARFKKYIDSISKKGVVFDLRFQLLNKDSLYCTEMVAEGVKYASHGKILVPPQQIDLAGTKYRNAFCLTQNTFWFYPIDKLQHAAFLKKKIIVFYPNYKTKKKG